MPSVASLLEQGHNQLDRGKYQAALQIFQQAAVAGTAKPQSKLWVGSNLLSSGTIPRVH